MTVKQERWYWREWSAVRKHCAAEGLPEPDRHGLHVQALGADKSHTDFSNRDFDRVLQAFWAISRPDDLEGQLREEGMGRTRLLVGIRQRGAEEYIRAIARDKFGTEGWEDLTEAQLVQLRDTLVARAAARRRKPKAVAAAVAGGEDPDWNV